MERIENIVHKLTFVKRVIIEHLHRVTNKTKYAGYIALKIVFFYKKLPS